MGTLKLTGVCGRPERVRGAARFAGHDDASEPCKPFGVVTVSVALARSMAVRAAICVLPFAFRIGTDVATYLNS